jgi:uncharacterized coiled-coil protein SlyX
VPVWDSIISGLRMSGVLNFVPRAVVFLAGVAAGAMTASRRDRNSADSSSVDQLKRNIAELKATIAANESDVARRFELVESRLDEQSAKLAEVPSTTQIIGAMEQILARSMASLDERLANQAHSIEVLRSTVTQTDGLLEKVLESLDSLQTYPESSEMATDSLLHRPAV